MFRQIDKAGVETRLTDPALFIFRVINNEDGARYTRRYEVYPISEFGTPSEIMSALGSENNMLFEESDNPIVLIPRLNLM